MEFLIQKALYKEYNFNTLIEEFQSFVDIYQPADSFVIDVCETSDKPGELQIIEINCINASGFYDIDMSKLIQALYNTYNNETEKSY